MKPLCWHGLWPHRWAWWVDRHMYTVHGVRVDYQRCIRCQSTRPLPGDPTTSDVTREALTATVEEP